MLALALRLVLTIGPTLAGSPPRPLTTALDYTQSVLYLSTPSLCSGASLTTDQAGAVTVTRASIVYCQTATTITTVAANKPVVEADGLRVEQSSSNAITSSDFDADWNGTNASDSTQITDPTGTASSAWILTSLSNGGYFSSPSMTIASTSATVSVFAAHDTSGTQAYAVELYDLTSSASKCIGTGTAAASGVWPTMKNRAFCTASITSGHSFEMRVYPGGTGGTGHAAFWGPMAEPGITHASSYIAAGGSRASDNVSFTTTSNTAAGCASAYATFTPHTGGRILSTGNGDVISSSDTTHLFANDGSTTITSPAVTSLVGRTIWAKTQWTGSTFKIYAESAGNVTSGSFDGSLGSTTFYIGSNQSVVQWFDGWITKIKVSTDPNGCAP